MVGVNIVVVEEPSIGAATDASGNFRIGNIAVGKYSLRASIIGYTPAVVTNVIVSTGRTTLIRIQLAEAPVQLEGVEVRADYFSKAGVIGAVSTHGLNSREIRLSPGAAEDMHRVMQILPGIGNSNDQNNELIVRGGAPDENLTILDHIEIPSPNHYPNQFNPSTTIEFSLPERSFVKLTILNLLGEEIETFFGGIDDQVTRSRGRKSRYFLTGLFVKKPAPSSSPSLAVPPGNGGTVFLRPQGAVLVEFRPAFPYVCSAPTNTHIQTGVSS